MPINPDKLSVLSDCKKVHFIGIGGIGLSAIAKMFLHQNVDVSGSDNNRSAIIDELEKSGAKISLEHKANNVSSECDLVVYTNAISKDNVELVEARKKGTRTLSYPEALGEISKEKFTIAISGNAGKTTTTAMIGQILIDAGLDPTIIVGSLVNFIDATGKNAKTNFISGEGRYFVVEADEYKRAFLNLTPSILAINNIEEDHLDYYKDMADIQSAFTELVGKVPREGSIICSTRDKKVLPVLNSVQAKVFNYRDTSLSGYSLELPGEHNRDNARVAVTIASVLNVREEKIKRSLKNFKGLWRRFEYKGRTEKGMLVYDDYAHNPKKIKALISGAKEKFHKRRIVMVFQPHLYSRTRYMLDLFAESFAGVDRIIVTPIYAARERDSLNISHHSLSREIKSLGEVKEIETVESLDEALYRLESESENTVCLTVGAGNIYMLGDKIIQSVDKL